MLLILTNSQDATADYLVPILDSHGIRLIRFDTDTALSKIKFEYANGVPRLQFDGTWYSPDDFTNVWYRRPERLKNGSSDASPEGKFMLDEWAETLEGFFAHIPLQRWINHPSCNFAASHKIEQLTRARSLGFLAPETLVTQDAEQLRAFFAQHNSQIVVKPMASGYVERPATETDTLTYTNLVLSDQLTTLDDLKLCPTLFQRFILKRVDVRITVIDGAVNAVTLTAKEPDGSQRCDIRRNNMDDVSYEAIMLPDEIEDNILALMASYKLRFAAIDMAIGLDGTWHFLEVNPNGQWAWIDLNAGTNIARNFIAAFANG